MPYEITLPYKFVWDSKKPWHPRGVFFCAEITSPGPDGDAERAERVKAAREDERVRGRGHRMSLDSV